jgi:hypothetical protein
MLDASLHLEAPLPPGGQTNFTPGCLDIGVDIPTFSDQWRQGRLAVFIPALPNATNASASIVLTLQDSADGGVTFANAVPLTQIVLPGVAVNGIPSYGPGGTNPELDMALPPGLRGPFRLSQFVDANIGGDCSSGLIEYWWKNE